MHMNVLIGLLADATAAPPAGAPSSAATPGQPQGSALGFVVPMILIFVIMYFMMIRPQSQQRKRQAQLLETLKSGDKVVTASGIVGVVVTVKDKTISLRSADAKMEMTKASVTEILERSGEEKSAA
jgi:preprotein translocase subunit YajC